MSPTAKRRSMTFTGCWTCKRRKVKCDERPTGCQNCAKVGVVCGGYGVRLQWVSDPFAPPQTSSRPPIGRIRIDRGSGVQYPMDEIDNFLVSIDTDGNSSTRKGPFSVFPSVTEECESSSTTTSPRSARTSSNCHSDSIPPENDTTPTATVPIAASNPPQTSVECSQLSDEPLGWQASFSLFDLENTTMILDGSPQSQQGGVDIFPGDISDEINGSPSIEDAAEEDDSDIEHATQVEDCGQTIQGRHVILNSSRVPEISLSITGDGVTDMLMHHYALHLADLLQPIHHPQNPYRNFYVPAALEAASSPVSISCEPKGQIHSVLYHSLLASSAFHLWRCNPLRTDYQESGAWHQQMALRLLQSAINASSQPAEYKTLLMTMLSMVTIGVMSGGEEDFAVHLQGTTQLRHSRRNWRIISNETRQLNEISAFLCLLARTTTFRPSLKPWTEQSSSREIINTPELGLGSCFGFMYGVTPAIASCIAETCRLAEHLTRYGKTSESIPEGLLQACEILGERLLAWSFETDTGASYFETDSDMVMIFEHHAKAWHAAALVYYYRRIQNYDIQDLAAETECVAKHMHAVEDLKLRSKSERASRMAPITWPAFISSCDAINHDSWTKWWERVQRYRIGNIRKQWDVVQHIWNRRGEQERTGLGSPNWMTIYLESGFTILPI